MPNEPVITAAAASHTGAAQAGDTQAGDTPRIARDVNTFIGGYPWRHIPHPEPDVLVRVLAREGVRSAWVGHLPSAFHRDPSHGNAQLLAALEPHRGTLHPVPAVRPGWPGWRSALRDGVARGAPAIRAYPQLWNMGVGDAQLVRLAEGCAEEGVALLLTTRFEDLRQRHVLDTAADLSAAHVRAIARAGTGARLVVTAAGREFIEEVHWGLTPAERALVTYDFSWVWGPPTDELASLVRTLGPEAFVYGTMWPLRLTQGPRANLELLPDALRASMLAHLAM
ncbi:MAG: hypothetical protein ABIZ91_04295 [Gemmatimonadaceae bacterium]